MLLANFVEINKHKIFDTTMLESLNYSFRNTKKHNLSNLQHQTVEKLQKKHGSSEDPSLVKNVDDLGLVY